MGPRAHNDEASSNSSASVRSSYHGDKEQPESQIGQYHSKPYYIFDEEGLPYDPWFDLRSSKTLPLLKLLADGDRLSSLSKTDDGRAEIADLFITLIAGRGWNNRKKEQAVMYVPTYGWFKPKSDPEFQDLYTGPNWEIPSKLKYLCPVTPPPVPKCTLPKSKTPTVLDSSSSREATPAKVGPSARGPSVRFPSPVGPQKRQPMPPVASPVPVAHGKPMQGSKAAEALKEMSRRTSWRTVKQTAVPPDVKPKFAPAKGPSTRLKKNLTVQPSSTVEPPTPSVHSEDELTTSPVSKDKSTAKGKGAFKSVLKCKFQESEGESEAPTPEKRKGKKPTHSEKKPKGSRVEDSTSYAPELKSDSTFDQAQKPDPAPGFLGFFDKPLSAYPRTQPQINALPKDEQWFFNPKANTQNSFIRAPDKSTPNMPLRHPWWPSLTAKYHATNSQPFQQLLPMSKKQISDITLKLLENPGFSCLECILFNQYCEFHRWNFQCTTCESQKHKGCSFWSKIFQRIADMQAMFIHAHRSQQIAAKNTIEFKDKFRELVQHANKTIEFIGAEQFESRFTPDNSMPDRMAQCVDKFNKLSASLSARYKSEHVASFNSQKSTHDDNNVSGFRFPSLKSQKDTLAAPEILKQQCRSGPLKVDLNFSQPTSIIGDFVKSQFMVKGGALACYQFLFSLSILGQSQTFIV
ncbi:hypothetical protein B0H13DRAFT_2376098 [Mycena leptocephala]|nr:hypothetical protein B0H13DRAFT_2376098 [Mycena leptocephala]